jgi:hypothetical protein
MASFRTGSDPATPGSAQSIPYRIREVDPDVDADAVTAARLHAQLFGEIGPIAKLGDRLLRRYCYDYLLRTDLMKAVLIEVGGEAAGLAAYTGDPVALHSAALRSHLPFLVSETLRALVEQPSLLRRLPAAAQLLWDRRRERLPVEGGKFAEVVAFGVLPQFLTRQFIRRTGLHVSDLLLEHVLDQVWARGFPRVRGVVLVSNKPAVSFFSVRASRVEPYPAAAKPSIQVWLDMDAGRAERLQTLKASRRPDRSSTT